VTETTDTERKTGTQTLAVTVLNAEKLTDCTIRNRETGTEQSSKTRPPTRQKTPRPVPFASLT